MAKKVPASIRNRNPGAQYPGPFARQFGSTTYEVLKSKDGTHKIATFPTHIQGAAATFALLSGGKSGGRYLYRDRPIEDAIRTWCGGFYVSTYIKVLETETGVTRRSKLTLKLLKDPDVAVPLARAMALQEAGRDYPMTEEEWKQAHRLAFPDAVEAERDDDSFAPDNDIPSPKPETRVIETAKKSNTIRGALLALLGGVSAAFSDGIAVMMDAATQISTWAPIQSTFGMVKGIGVALLVGGVTLAIYRRLVDARDGRA